MKIIATMSGDFEVIPTTEGKEMQIEYHGIQFKDSLKFSIVLSNPSWLRRLKGTWTSTCTPRLNSGSTVSLGASNGMTSKSIC